MRHLWTLVVTSICIVASGWIAGGIGLEWLSQSWLVGIGVMILMAYAAGELLRTTGLPALLGWIAVGIFMGPSFATLLPTGYPLAVITEEVIENLALVQVLIVGLIGMLAGAKFRVSDLSGNTRLPVVLTGAFLILVVPLVMGGVLVTAQLFPDQLAFIADQPVATQVTIALFFGVLSFGLAPSVTVAMLQELRARGPMATVVLGAVILAEVVLFVLFAIVLTLGRAVVGPEGVSVGLVIDAVPEVAWQLSLSALLGLGVGVVTALYFRFVKREPLLFLLVALVVGYFGVAAVDAEPLLTFLVGGFFVQNLTRQGDLLVKVLERIALPVFVVYFATVAAGIDLEGTLTYLPLVLVLVVARCVGLYWGARWASTGVVRNNHIYEYLRTSFFSQDAVVLVLAGVVAHPDEPFGWGAEFQSVIVATVVAYLIAGPILLKLGLDRSGETRRARRALSGEDGSAEGLDEAVSAAQKLSDEPKLEAALRRPRFEDAWLRGHIEDLRQDLLEQTQQTFLKPVQVQFDELYQALGDVSRVVEDQATDLDTLVLNLREGSDPEQLMEMARTLQKQYAQAMIDVVQRIEATSGVAIGPEEMRRFFDRLREVEDQQSLYRIEREAVLDQPGKEDPGWLRLVKTTQRLRSRFVGLGYRTVPVGKLWRYYVQLALPVRLAQRTPEVVVHYEKFWKRLWRHLRYVDEFWDELIDGITDFSGAFDAESTESQQGEKSRDAECARQAKDLVERFFLEFRREQQQLDTMLETGARLVQHRFSDVVVRSYQQFVAAAGKAGTIYLPQFRYRASARFNQGRRAEHRVVDRLNRQQTVVSGYRGWIRLDHEVATFEQWIHLFRNEIAETIDEALGGQWSGELEALAQACGQVVAGGEGEQQRLEEAKAVYHDELRPRIAAFRQRQEELVARLHNGDSTRSLTQRIDERINRLPEKICVLSGSLESMAVASAHEHHELFLRRWIMSQVGQEMSLRVVDFNERAAERIERRLALLSGVEQALEFNLVTAQKEASDLGEEQDPLAMARDGLVRAQQLIEGFLEGVRSEKDELLDWFDAGLVKIVATAVEPIEKREPGAIQRRLARIEGRSLVGRGESWVSGIVDPMADRLGRARRRTQRKAVGLKASLRRFLVEEIDDVDRVQRRQFLDAGSPFAFSEAPPVYRRLFVPMPLDIPQFYRHHRASEEMILETVEEFFDGQAHSLLISGERGVGKRTLIRHLIPSRVYAVQGGLREEQVATVNLARIDRDEASLCGQLGRAIFGRKRGTTFAALGQSIRSSQSDRQVVVVEQGDRLWLRTEEGVEMARRFLEMVVETAEDVLWVIIMGRGATDYLRVHLDLDSYFTHHERLHGLDARSLEELVMARHQVSGFDLQFQAPSMNWWQRLRRPLFGPASRQFPRELFFRRLTERSRGNPRSALLHWLRSVRLDPIDESKIIVEPLEPLEIEFLASLSVEQNLLLTMVSLHQAVQVGELADILGQSPNEVRRQVRHLKRLGFLEAVPDTDDEVRIRAIVSVWVERELRQKNLI